MFMNQSFWQSLRQKELQIYSILILYENGGGEFSRFLSIQDENKLEDAATDTPAVVFHLPGNSEIRSADASFSLQISSAV